MSYIRGYKAYQKAKKQPTEEKSIKEATIMKMGNEFKVKSIADVSQSLVNAYVKKVKAETGKELRDFFSDMDIAEQLVKYSVDTNLNVDAIPTAALLGDNAGRAEDDSTPAPVAEPVAEEPVAEIEPVEEVPVEEPVAEPVEEVPTEEPVAEPVEEVPAASEEEEEEIDVEEEEDEDELPV